MDLSLNCALYSHFTEGHFSCHLGGAAIQTWHHSPRLISRFICKVTLCSLTSVSAPVVNAKLQQDEMRTQIGDKTKPERYLHMTWIFQNAKTRRKPKPDLEAQMCQY